jgi:hypothetical protein
MFEGEGPRRYDYGQDLNHREDEASTTRRQCETRRGKSEEASKEVERDGSEKKGKVE